MKKTFNEIAAQIERIERLYYNFGCGTKKMLETAESFFSTKNDLGLCFTASMLFLMVIE